MRRLILLAVSVLFLLSAGCSTIRHSEGEAIEFYYSVSSDKHFGSAVGSETDYLENPTVSNVMNRLLEQPYSADLTSIIPEGTYLQSWTLEKGQLKLDLSEAFGRLAGISLTKGEYCIVLTMIQLEGVETVSITVDGQTIPGGVTGAMSEDDVILKGETEDPVTISTQLYFPLSDDSGLGVEYRVIEVPSLDPMDQANTILKELALGPSEEEMDGFLTNTGELEAISVTDGTCVVEIDSMTLESICQPEELFYLHLYAIVDSLTELGTIEQVSFLMDGAPVEGWEAMYSAQYEF